MIRFDTPLSKSRRLQEVAEELNDDELHAAAVIQLTPIRRNPNVARWLEGLLMQVDERREQHGESDLGEPRPRSQDSQAEVEK